MKGQKQKQKQKQKKKKKTRNFLIYCGSLTKEYNPLCEKPEHERAIPVRNRVCEVCDLEQQRQST
jgi:hypothetical protein